MYTLSPRLIGWTIAVVLIGLCGCATIQTMPTLATPGGPKIYSGSRLDIHSIAGTEESRFKVEAPIHPLIDLPFSVLLDTAILVVTVPVTLYEFVFGP